LTIFAKLKDSRQLGWAHLCAGMHFAANEDFDALEQHTQAAHRLLQEVDDKEGLATVFTFLGEIARLRDSEYTAAEDWYEKSLALSRELDHRYYICANLFNLRSLAAIRSNFDRHHALMRESLMLAWRNKIWDMCAYAMYGLADGLKKKEEDVRAARLLGAYESFLDRHGIVPQAHEAATIE
jgi:hypothetical protein